MNLKRHMLIGLILAWPLMLAIAWLPALYPVEVSPVPICTRAWPVDAEHAGVVLDDHFVWWLPFERQTSMVCSARLELTREQAADPARFDGPMVYFTGHDTWATSFDPQDLYGGPPDWHLGFINVDGEAPAGVDRYAAGWPLRCFEGYRVCYPAPQDVDWSVSYHGALAVNWRVLPWMPRFLPLAGNLLLFCLVMAAISKVASVSICSIGRVLRGKPGCCRECRYDLAGLAHAERCPECGSPVSESSKRSRG